MANWRAFLLRRLLGRLRIDADIVRHLSTFQRLGETLEVEAPGEMLPVGARTVLRAVRTQAAAQIRPEWVWPYWLERQLDPGEASFVPRGHLPFITNLTHRNWTMVGVPRSAWEAIVDPAGLVTPWFDGWSLDWWVRDPDGWRFPSREGAVSQTLLGAAPVVRTAMPVADGEVVHRAYGALARGEDVAVVEVENATGERVEVALALRPYNPEGLAVVETVAAQGSRVHVDGRLAALFSRAPDRSIVSTFARGDTAALLSREGPEHRGGSVRDRAGLAQAAAVFSLGTGERIRAAMPLDPERRTHLRRTARRRLAAPPRIDVAALPGPADVAVDWERRLTRGMRVGLPDENLQRAVDANRAYMLLFHDREDITPGPFTYHRFWFRDAAYELAALDRWGFHEEAAEVLRSYPGRQRPDGFFYSQWKEWDSNGAAIWSVAEHDRLARDDALLWALAPAVRRGAEWIGRKLRDGRRAGSETDGLLPAGVSAEHLGPFDYYYWDDFWALRGLLDAGHVLERTGDRAGAAACRRIAERLRRDLFASIERAARRVGRRLLPAGPRRGVDAGLVGSLVAVWPLRLLDADDPWVRETLAAIGERFLIGDAFFQAIAHTGLGTYLTLQIAFVELERGDPAAWRRFRWLLDAATPTFAWPEAIHPRLGTGCMGDGHHGWAAADFLSFLRAALVRETHDGRLALLSVLPEEWRGAEIEVRDAPTHWGRVSFRLRWRDEHPELAWERERAGVPLLAPALDGAWSSDERSGEAVLAPGAPARPR